MQSLCADTDPALLFPKIKMEVVSKQLLETSIHASLLETRHYPDVNLTQLRLENGMTVWLKPTDYETDEISIKLAALGGYAALPEKDRASGELAASIAWESGMGPYSSDQISVLLYEHSLDFVPKIQAYSRSVEGNSRKDSLAAFFQCINMIFMQQNFNQVGLQAALRNATNSISKIACDYDHVYEAMLLQLNTQGVRALQPLSLADLSQVDFAVARDFFQQCFADPADFVIVLVGSFDIEETKALLNRYLGVIPRKNTTLNFAPNFTASFPPGITQKEIRLTNRADSLTRITFPWQKPMSDRKIYKMAFICQIIEARLRRVITEQMKLSYGVDVSYEFPYFPYPNNPWISIRFRCDMERVKDLKRLILAELKNLQDNGVDKEEIEEIQRLEAGSNDFWLRDNFYWMSMLTNYYLWKWDPEWIYRGEKLSQELTPDYVNSLIRTGFTLTNYSVLTATP